jgi:hypothetical protein
MYGRPWNFNSEFVVIIQASSCAASSVETDVSILILHLLNRMFQDAWRMLRDYFYDTDMTGLPWDAIFDRYLPLVERCCKREELDDGMFTCFFCVVPCLPKRF